MRSIIIAFFLCLVIGCKTIDSTSYVAPETDGTIQIEDIYVTVGVHPSNGSVISDKTYYLPTKHWIKTVYVNYLSSKFYNKKYKLESFDCDNFSLGAQEVASDLNSLNDYQLAIGEFFYIQESTNRGHAINFFLYKEGGDVRMGFIEPQNGRIVYLTRNEIASCIYWKI